MQSQVATNLENSDGAVRPVLAPKRCVGIDMRALGLEFKAHAVRGTGRYVLELGRYFERFPDKSLKVRGFVPNELKAPDLGSRFLEAMARNLPFGRTTFEQQICYPRKLNGSLTKDLDVLHFPAHIDAPSWCKKPYIVTVLDLIPLVLRDLYAADKPGWRFKFARWLEIQAILHASLVLTISECGARDVERLLKIPRERIVVTHLGVDESFFGANLQGGAEVEKLRAQYGVEGDRKIVLYVGGIDQRKNMRGLIESFSMLCSKMADAKQDKPLLLLAGKVYNDAEYPKLQKLIRAARLEHDVRFAGFVEEADLRKLYQLSSVFFFPSLYEGFGFTPLEALASGCPVVSSNRSAMPEVLGEAALPVDPERYAECAEALFQVLTNTALSAKLRSAGPLQARKFPWSKTGEKTYAAYETVLAR